VHVPEFGERGAQPLGWGMKLRAEGYAEAVEDSARRLTEAGIGWVHDHLMRILLELDATTKAAGVSYYLAYGTAIGALRHRDFIPWDIDADVFIWSHEYEQLIEALRERLPEDVTLNTPDEDGGYPYLFARLGMRGVDHAHVHVDLFPLEPAPASRWKQRVYSVGTRLCCQMYLVKQMSPASRAHYTREKRLVARVGKIVLSPVPSWVLRRVFGAFTRWFAVRSPGEVVANSCGSYGLREFFRRSWFDAAVPTRFRGSELQIPSGSREMLEWIYGDFMTPVQDDELEFIEDHFVGPLRSHGIV
jgi:lipopolysaccharide cholinephosphotransferase